MREYNIIEFFQNKIFIIIEILLIITYLSMILCSINISIINIILGVICVLFLPGYNLLNVIKPRFNLIEKLGYMTILSLAIANILMFFSYIFLYDIITTPEKPDFFFNDILLLSVIQLLSIIFILIKEVKKIKNNRPKNHFQTNIAINEVSSENNNKKFYYINGKFLRIREKARTLFFFISFLVSVIFLCVSTFSSYDPSIPSTEIYYLYLGSEYLFFYKVPFLFYIFLFFSILFLICIVFFTKNHFLILFSISLFMYCLWILPYFQIGYFFNKDAYKLSLICKSYEIYGLRADKDNSFLVYLEYKNMFSPFRYPTSIFTGLILTWATGVPLDVTLWYLYPLIFAFIPFFCFSAFQKFKIKEKQENLSLILLTIIAILSPQFLKYTHSATTGVLGTYIYLILVMEFFELINEKDKRFKGRYFLLISLLFFFLCLTHLEECIYFIILILFYSGYFIFFELKDCEINRAVKILHLKKTLILVIFVLLAFSFIFCLTQEFFGYIDQYFYSINPYSGENVEEYLLYKLYKSTKIEFLNFSRLGFDISLFFYITLILGAIILFVVYYIFLFKYFDFTFKVYVIILKYFKIIFNFLANKLLLILAILIMYFIIYPVLQGTELFYVIIEILGANFIFIFNMFLFCKGFRYYQAENHKQNYFLLTIIASSSLMIGLFLLGNIYHSYYLLNARFFSYFIFFNLIILQNNYFRYFINKKKIFLIILIFCLLSLGIFYSLSKLTFG